MADLTYAQLEGQWINAGGDPSLAPLMAAIAEAESGGDPNSVNATDNGGKQTSWGLWQISNGDHTAPSPNWNNPAVNASLAVQKYQDQGLGAWGTYASGAYKAFLNSSTTPDTAAVAVDTSAATGAAAQTAAQSESNCAWRINFNIPLIGGDICLLSWSHVRAITAVALLAGGSLLAVFGVSSLLGTTGPGKMLAGLGGFIAGPEVGLVTTAAAAKSSKAAEESAQERHTARQYARQRRARENMARDDERVPF